MKRLILNVSVLVLLVLSVSACNIGGSEGSATPQAAVVTYHKALQANDPDLLWHVWRESGYNAAKLRVAIYTATVELDNAIETAYGDYKTTGRVRGAYRVDIDNLLENAEVHMADENAFVSFNVEYVPGKPVGMLFETQKIDGRWYVQIAGATVDPDLDKRGKKVLEVLREAKELVDNNGFTVKEIDWYVRVLKSLAKDISVGFDPQDKKVEQQWLERQCTRLGELAEANRKFPDTGKVNINEVLADKLISEIAARMPLGNTERERMQAMSAQNLIERRKARENLIGLLCD